MTPNATPTRADVLREFADGIEPKKCKCAECVAELLAEEVLRLRAHRDAMIRRVEAMQRYVPVEGLGRGEMEACDWGAYVEHAAVLAALREGGDA